SISAALGGTALFSALGNLKVMAAATQGVGCLPPGDYKALVCIFLHGGNDSFSTLIPYNTINTAPGGNGNTYATWLASRPALAQGLDRPAIEALSLSPEASHLPGDGASYGLNP